MNLNKGLTAYPILISGDDDYVDSYFDASLLHSIEFEKIHISIEFKLINKGLQQLINCKKVKFAAHFESPLLSYRNIVLSDLEKLEHIIDLNDISDKLEISTFLVATEDIPDYYNDKFNWEFGKEKVSIAKGNIMAIGPLFNIDVNRDKDGLKKLSDVICIRQYDNAGKPEISVQLESDVIVIFVNKNIKNQYYVNGKPYLYNIISMIMVPTMLYVLTCMKNDDGGLSGYRWFSVIQRLLKQNGVEINQLTDSESSGKYSIFGLAQKIFKSPIEKGLMELNKERSE